MVKGERRTSIGLFSQQLTFSSLPWWCTSTSPVPTLGTLALLLALSCQVREPSTHPYPGVPIFPEALDSKHPTSAAELDSCDLAGLNVQARVVRGMRSKGGYMRYTIELNLGNPLPKLMWVLYESHGKLPSGLGSVAVYGTGKADAPFKLWLWGKSGKSGMMGRMTQLPPNADSLTIGVFTKDREMPLVLISDFAIHGQPAYELLRATASTGGAYRENVLREDMAVLPVSLVAHCVVTVPGWQ